jgi:hypothetical protein
MTSPFVVSVGTAASAATGVNITPGLPAGYTLNDIFLLFVETDGNSVSAAAINASGSGGYAQLGPDNTNGTTIAAAGTTRLTVFWKRTSAAEVAPTFDNGNGMIYAVMMAVRGCRTVGDPFFVLEQFVKITASTAYSSQTGNSESVDDSLIVYGLSNAISGTGAQLSGQANATLTNLTKQFDAAVATGSGGGLAIVTGNLATAGPTGTLTGTWASSTADVTNGFAMIPATAVDIVAAPRTAEIQIFYANASGSGLTSTWVKPYGAKIVDVYLNSAGGGGGNGRSTSTTAAGGGGGGGAFVHKRFRAIDLAATVLVQAGAGGAGGAAAAAGGNNGGNGGNTTFQSASVLVASGAVGGVGATSGVGGTGGNGGGLGTAAAASTQAFGGQGAGGGAAATAGGAGEGGGGAGGGGGIAAAGGAGGNSFHGGGGGGGGSTTATGANGGGGGGTGIGGGNAGNGGAAAFLPMGGGGGGGGNSTTAGGIGGLPGGGGGGGGDGTAGGNGANGMGMIVTWF